MKKSLLFLLLIIPAICFSSSNYLDGDVVEEIKALEKQIKECEATVKALLPELKATLDGESFDIGVFKDMEIAEACLQKNINDLNILKELYPNLFKTLTASIYQENPNAMLAMMQFQSAIGGLYN